MAAGKTPRILGILSMCLGGLAALTSTFGLVMSSTMKGMLTSFGQLLGRLPRGRGQQDPAAMMERAAAAADSVRGYQIAQSAGLLVLSVALFAIGFGLYQRRPWSRKAAIGWAVAALCFLPVMVWIQAGVIQPATQAAVFQGLPQGPPGAEAIMRGVQSIQTVAAVVGTLTFYAPFPIVLLVILGKRKSAADFEPQGEAS